MSTILTLWRRGLTLLGRVEQGLVVLLLVNIVVNIFAQVISRYLFGKPLVWVEELAVYSFIWATFLGAGLAMKYDRHLRIETFVDRLGRVGGALLRGLGAVFVAALLVSLIPTLMAAIDVEMRRQTIALPVQLPVGWFFSVPLLVGTLSMIVTAAYHAAVELHRVLGAAPPPPILVVPGSDEPEFDGTTERILAGEITHTGEPVGRDRACEPAATTPERGR